MNYRITAQIVALCGTSCLQVALAEDSTVLLRQEIPRVPSLTTTKGTIGDKQCMFIIDTGAEFTILDQSLTGLLKGKLQDGSYDDGSGRQTPLPFYHAPPMKFQSLETQNPIVAVLDIRPIGKYVDRNVIGVLGVNHLGAGKLVVDYDQGVLEIHTGPWKLKDGLSTEIDLEDHLALPTFETYIAGRYGQFLVDTGGFDTITLEKSLFTALVRNGSIEVSESGAHTLGASGMVEVRSGWFLKGELMGKSLAGTAVHETFGRSSVGTQWLYGFNFEVDFKIHRFRYQQRRASRAPASVYLMIGAILVFGDSGPKVERLSPEPGGAAQLAGLNPGDIIEEFDSLTAAEMNYASVAELVTMKAGQAIPIRFIRKSDGVKTQTTLKLPTLISSWNFGGRGVP